MKCFSFFDCTDGTFVFLYKLGILISLQIGHTHCKGFTLRVLQRFQAEGFVNILHSWFLGSLWLLVCSPLLGSMKNTPPLSLHQNQCSHSMIHQCIVAPSIQEASHFIQTWASFLNVDYPMRIWKILSKSSVHQDCYFIAFSL